MRELKDGTKVLTIGFSPCPNDTYIFDALVNGKIDTGSLRFEPLLQDVEELNRGALIGLLDITKLSYRAYAEAAQSYILCDSGSALGRGVGPLLVTAAPGLDTDSDFTVAIPGLHTTANFLFRMFYPHVTRFCEMVFSEIEDAVAAGDVDAGVIIHENRFTYKQKGLFRISDLGEAWETETRQPIPLGGIAIRRSLPGQLCRQVNGLIRQSVEFADLNPEGTEDYVALHAQSMEPAVRRQHIGLYVNRYSVDLGDDGRAAIRYFYDKALTSNVLKTTLPEPIFISDL
jgi:1,4-dihydroxy-6-naphthoate synthase